MTGSWSDSLPNGLRKQECQLNGGFLTMRSNLSRNELRQGGGRGTGDEHIDEVLGSTEFDIFIAPNKRVKGYPALRQSLETDRCHVTFPADSQYSPGPKYQVVKITNRDIEIPASALKRAHRWAHQRNFLHSFFKPMSLA